MFHFFLLGKEFMCETENQEKQEMAIFVTIVTTVPSSRLSTSAASNQIVGHLPNKSTKIKFLNPKSYLNF